MVAATLTATSPRHERGSPVQLAGVAGLLEAVAGDPNAAGAGWRPQYTRRPAAPQLTHKGRSSSAQGALGGPSEQVTSTYWSVGAATPLAAGPLHV